MTVKQELAGETRKLAAAVREALVKFSEETGMQASISVDWVTSIQLDQDAPVSVVGSVRIDVGGLSVSA